MCDIPDVRKQRDGRFPHGREFPLSQAGIGLQMQLFMIAFAAIWPVLFSAKAGVESVDPRFLNAGGGVTGDANAYRLQSTSPLINAGMNLALLGISPGSEDFFGNALSPESFDIGAHESLS